MSTIPLSAREGYMQNISGEDAPPPSIERDDSKLDALIEAAIDNASDTITDRTKIKENDDKLLPVDGEGWAALISDPDREAPAPREAGLENIIRGREEKLAERETGKRRLPRLTGMARHVAPPLRRQAECGAIA